MLDGPRERPNRVRPPLEGAPNGLLPSLPWPLAIDCPLRVGIPSWVSPKVRESQLPLRIVAVSVTNDLR